jgi:hypothetical protein
MLRVTVEIVPRGVESRASVIGRLEVANVTEEYDSDNEYGEIADYRVRGFRRSEGFWKLIERAVNERPATAADSSPEQHKRG